MTIGRPRILAIDDEADNLKALAGVLRDEYDLSLAKSGAGALERLRRSPEIDLILLDIGMPDIDGFEVLRRLQDNPRTAAIPVIFVTGWDTLADEVRGLELGAVDYLIKPVQPAVARARIALHLRLRRQQTELERYRATMMSVGDGVIATAADGTITMMNPGAEMLTGWPVAGALGKPLADVLRLFDETTREPLPSRARPILSTAPPTGNPPTCPERLMLRSRDGRDYPVDVGVTPILDGGGETTGTAVIISDRTRERHMLHHVEHALAGERNARERLRTFIDMATHEFKTPLTTIDSAVQVLKLLVDCSRPEVDSRFDVIRRAVRRIVDLVDTCLTSERIDEDLPVKFRPFDPVALTSGVVQRQRAMGASCVVDTTNLPENCVGDPDLLGIALEALVDNARRYGPADAAIEVTGSQTGESLAFVVADRGPGIPAEEASAIYEKYFRGSHSRAQPGTGIGLSLVQSIARLHRGNVVHRPRAGGGTIFTLIVPLVQPDAGTPS